MVLHVGCYFAHFLLRPSRSIRLVAMRLLPSLRSEALLDLSLFAGLPVWWPLQWHSVGLHDDEVSDAVVVDVLQACFRSPS